MAIITGSARGIGAETARMLAQEGACVVVTDLDLDAATDNARTIEAAGGKAIAVACDVRKEEAGEAARRRCAGGASAASTCW
ncbi:SDR family NAD(P)-dependent oxidoreductase [Cupriavidus basilensis]